MAKTHDIFMCHSGEDKEFVRKLAGSLRKYGVKVWLDESELVAGDSLHMRIQEGIVRSSFMLVVISKRSLRRPWIVRELTAGLAQELKRQKVFVIPALLGVSARALPALLADKLAVDFGSNYGLALKAILRRLGISDRDARMENPTSEQVFKSGRRLLGWHVTVFLKQCWDRRKKRANGDFAFRTDYLHFGERNALNSLARRDLVRIKLIGIGKYNNQQSDLSGSKGWLYEGVITKLGQKIVPFAQNPFPPLDQSELQRLGNQYCPCGSGEKYKRCHGKRHLLTSGK